jgi:glycosyltransferase involved in cell wall biosynthesis
VTRILFVTSSLDESGSTSQLLDLLRALAPDGPRLCVLGRVGRVAAALADLKVPVEVLPGDSLFALATWGKLRRLVDEAQPAVIHAWRLPLRWLLALLPWSDQLVVTPRLVFGSEAPWWSWFERRLLRRARCVLALSAVEAELLRGRGALERQLVVAPPGLFVPELKDAPTPAGWPAGRVILSVGPFDRRKNALDAVWATNVLWRVEGELRLVLAGDGPDLPRLIRRTGLALPDALVHFLGWQGDLTPCYRHAQVVWATGRPGRGIHAVLEAMAHGLPVVAFAQPALADLIVDGEHGYLVPPGDRVTLARRTLQLLRDPETSRRVGAAARARVASEFRIERLAECCRQVYQ